MVVRYGFSLHQSLIVMQLLLRFQQKIQEWFVSQQQQHDPHSAYCAFVHGVAYYSGVRLR